MQIVPVIDVMGGRVVRAIAGDRANYQPIQSTLFAGSEPRDVIAALRRATNSDAVYVADLDSLSHGSSFDTRALEQLSLHHDCQLWIDADWLMDQSSLVNLGSDSNCRPIISLETLNHLDDLKRLFDKASDSTPIFSVDMRGGRLLTKSETLGAISPEELIIEACHIGFRDVITLDLAAVGSNEGPMSSASISKVMKRLKNQCLWISGGGVRDVDDLIQLEKAGCDYALVASALHDGKLSAKDAARFAKVRD